MNYFFVTLFPEIIETYTTHGVIGSAVEKGIINIKTVDLRKFGVGKHSQVDDNAYGGGGGMVMMFEPIKNALDSITTELSSEQTLIIATTAKGKKYSQSNAKEILKNFRNVIIICGRYEGFDQRVLDELVNVEFNLGNFVVSGGELPGLMIMDSISRMIPDVLGNEESYKHDSFYSSDNKIQHPQYTRPEEISYNGKILKVPNVLLSGNHQKIDDWRKENEQESE